MNNNNNHYLFILIGSLFVTCVIAVSFFGWRSFNLTKSEKSKKVAIEVEVNSSGNSAIAHSSAKVVSYNLPKCNLEEEAIKDALRNVYSQLTSNQLENSNIYIVDHKKIEGCYYVDVVLKDGCVKTIAYFDSNLCFVSLVKKHN